MKHSRKIIKVLDEMFPHAKGELHHTNAFELLIAVTLSAQTTDVAVNKVTPKLFIKYPTPKDLKNAQLEDVEQMIKTIGLYKTKAKNIIALSRILDEKFAGEVPNNRNNLESLPGVGRKTANVVLSICFDLPAIAVDTHVFRISHRLGLSSGKTPLAVENDLMSIFPKKRWTKLHHQLIFFGRYHCKATKPNCQECPLFEICQYDKKSR